MSIERSLFQGEHINITQLDVEKDAEVISAWTHDAETMRLCELKAVKPYSPWKIKKVLEAMEREVEDKQRVYLFAIHSQADKRLVGLVLIDAIDWAHGSGRIRLLIGDKQDHRKGYAKETLAMMLHYSFAELNLHRLQAVIPEYNQVALGLFTKAGFAEEVRQRQAINRFGQRWDMISMGILKFEWQASLQPA
jgi:RimJ/RimL family protein N-acetyltransferase